jgi:hypothetical protein
MKTTVCLEDLVEAPALTSEPPIDVGAAMRTADEKSRTALHALSSDQNTLTELEVMEGFLRKNADSMGEAGVVFANLAFESVLNAANVANETPTINPTAFQSQPQEAIEQAGAVLTEKKNIVVENLKKNSAVVLEMLSARLQTGMRYIEQLRKEASHLKGIAEALPADIPSSTSVGLWQGSEFLLYDGGGVYPVNYEAGARAIKDITAFLNGHKTAFSAAVSYYSDWFTQHEQNLLVRNDALNQLSYNPNQVFCFGMHAETFLPDSNEAIYRSDQLPGMFAYRIKTAGAPMCGDAAVKSLLSIRGWFDWYDSGRRQENMSNLNRNEDTQLKRLDKTECLARLSEIESAIDALAQWSDLHHQLNWRNLDFNRFYEHISRLGDSSLPARQVGELAAALLMFINESSTGVFDYAGKLLDNALVYVARSLGERSQ